MHTQEREKRRVLIVEDNATTRRYLDIILAPEYEVVMAENGAQGVKLTLDRMPDAVLCDLMMPVKDGFDYCREVRQDTRTSHIPIIIITARAEEEDIIRGTRLGADDYLIKPFNPALLRAKLDNLICGRDRLKKSFQQQLSAAPLPTPSEETQFMQTVRGLIDEHMHDSAFGVLRLGALLRISQPTLYRKVKQATGHSVVRLIRDIRLEKAAELLADRRHTIRDVAEVVGYNDLATFRKHFVRRFGINPSRYVPEAQ